MTDGPVEPATQTAAVSGRPQSGSDGSADGGSPSSASDGATTPAPRPNSLPAGAGSGPTVGVAPRPGTAGTTTARRPLTVGTAAATRKPGRRARLTVKRIDPWSTLKFSFFYGLAGLVVLFVAVILLYSIIDAMGVLDSLRSFFSTVDDTGSNSINAWFGFGRVMLVTLVVGIVNVVLFTAFATLTAFIYNVCTDIVGGVEVTLAERG